MASPEYATAMLSESGRNGWAEQYAAARGITQRFVASPDGRLIASPNGRFMASPNGRLMASPNGRVIFSPNADQHSDFLPIRQPRHSTQSIPTGMLGDMLFARSVGGSDIGVSPMTSPHPSMGYSIQGPSVGHSGRLHSTDLPCPSPEGQGPKQGAFPSSPHAVDELGDEAELLIGVEGEGATKWQMVFNVLNLYVGLGLLSQSYGFAKGGWMTAAVLTLCAGMFNWTGKLICRAFASIPVGKYEDCGGESYPNLGHAAFTALVQGWGGSEEQAERYGQFGRTLVIVLSVLEFFGAAAMSMIIYWQCAMPLVHVNPQKGEFMDRLLVSAVLTLLLLPSVCVRSFSDLSIISFFGFVTSALILTSIIVIACAENSGWKESHKTDPWDYGETDVIVLDTMPMALGLILLTFSAHACLPSFKKAMKDPERDFEPMLNVSFVFILLVNLGLAAVGYLVFGRGARTLITTNVRETVSESKVWQKSFALIVQGFVAFKSYCTVVPCVAVCVEMLLERFGSAEGTSPRALKVWRVVVTLVISVGSFVAQDYLGAVEALVGGVCSMSTSLIFPVAFYYLLNRDHTNEDGTPVMPRGKRILYICVTILSLLAMCGVVASAIGDTVTGGAQDPVLPPEST